MKNFLNYLKHVPKKAFMGLAMIGLIVAPLAINAGWSPSRPVKDWHKPADRTGFNHVTFNSFINTPNYGDERAFYDAKDVTNTSKGGFQDQINVKDGQTLLLRAYVHNGANPGLNASGKGVAKNTKIRMLVPTGTDRALRSLSYVSADNAQPGTVSDTVDFVNEEPFRLEYVAGSARAYTNAVPKGYQVNDSIVTSGASIGNTGPNGTIPGCFEFDTLVTLQVKVKQADFTVTKQVRKEGTKEWKENITANPGDRVEYQIAVKNNSDAQLRNVIVGDKLPAHVKYINGTTMLKNGNNPNGLTMQSNNIVSGGVNIGHYNPGAAGYVKFTAQVTGSKDELECGENTLRNKAVVQPESMDHKEDTADVTVNKTCQPPHKPSKPGQKVTSVKELPNTGPAETAAFGAVGSGALGIGIRNFLRSRKSLLETLLSK